jgi:hypothetical protein
MYTLGILNLEKPGVRSGTVGELFHEAQVFLTKGLSTSLFRRIAAVSRRDKCWNATCSFT